MATLPSEIAIFYKKIRLAIGTVVVASLTRAAHKALDPFGIEITAHSLADSRFERSRLSPATSSVANAALNEDMTGFFCDALKII